VTQPATPPPPPRVALDLEAFDREGQTQAERKRSQSDIDTCSVAPSEDEALSAGMPLDDKHVVDGEIGRGGMGRVLRVRDVDLNRDVAMKVLLNEGGDATRFIEEAQITGQLDHPNVLPVHDMGVGASGELFFTMKLVRGHKSLKDWIALLEAGDREAHRQLSFERRVQIVQQLCEVLDYAHQRGVVHRDLKPSNVVLGDFGEVYLVDWGVAKLVEPTLSPGELPEGEPVQTIGSLDREQTAEGELIGTIPYMSPEQVIGRQDAVGPWSDLYSLSAVLYEFLALHHYLSGLPQETYVQTLASIVHSEPTPAEAWVSSPNGRVPRSLSMICVRGLAKNPKDRYRSARELRQDLQLWLEGRSPMICPGTTMQRGLSAYSRWIDRHPFWLPIATLVLLVIVLQGALQWLWQVVQALMA
jgi:eukaryotic-like serine/threonine-protein kinase